MTMAMELDVDGIKQWSRLAARSDTIEEFLEKIAQ